MIMLIFPALVETLDFLVTEQRECVEWCPKTFFVCLSVPSILYYQKNYLQPEGNYDHIEKQIES
jgi:hypothetical protein